MGGFDAGQELAALSYDFSTLPGLDLLPDEQRALLENAKGVIPEPSQDAVERFERANLQAVTSTGLPIDKLASIAALGDDASQEQMAQALGGLEGIDVEGLPQKAREAKHMLFEAAVEVCGGSPSPEVFEALPARLREAFVGYLVGELLRPTRPTSASTPSRAAVNGASAVT